MSAERDGLTRRRLLRVSLGTALIGLAAACGPAAPTAPTQPTAAPVAKPTAAPAATTSAPAATSAPATAAPTTVFIRDYPVILSVNMMSAVVVLLGNLLADVGYAAADPRIRYA